MTDLVAPIKEVTVYSNRALVTRVGEIHLPTGTHELRVNDLPPFLQESLRASGRGPQGTRILNVDVATAFHSRPPEAELQVLQTACDLLQQQIDLLEARQDGLNDRRQWLRTLGEQSSDFARGMARGQIKPQDCADFFTFAAEQALQNAEAAQDLDIHLRQKQEDLAAKRRELAQKQGYGQPDRFSAVIDVELVAEGDFSLELSYLVTQAWWRPQYDVRVVIDADGNRGEVELTYVGLVQQSTGENWDQISLALSTARPSQATVLPELHPLYLQAYTPPPPVMPMGAAPMLARSAMSRPMRMKRTDGGSDDETEPSLIGAALLDEAPQAKAQVATTDIEQLGTAYIFRVGHVTDIPSGNSPHKTTIARDNLPCEFDYVSAPSIEQTVHLRAHINNTTDRVLLPGESSIFLSGEYVGTTRVKLTAPSEKFEIFLGIDDTIKVKREQTERSVEKGALLQGDLRRTNYGYRITMHNYAAFPRTIIVRDQFPVSQHERIKVKTQAIQPAPTERTRQELLTWRFVLAAANETRIDYRFTVEHPQDMQVEGLP